MTTTTPEALQRALAPDDLYELPEDLEAATALTISRPSDRPNGLCGGLAPDICPSEASEWRFMRIDGQEVWQPVCNDHKDPNQRFRVDDAKKANWAMRQAAAAQAELDEIDALFDEDATKIRDALDALEALREKAKARATHKRSYMEAQLILYLRDLCIDEPDRRRVVLPSGEVSFTRTQKVIISDRDALIAWAREHDIARDVVVEEIAIGANSRMQKGLKALLRRAKDKTILPYIEGNEERVPGVEIRPDDNFHVKPA